VGSKKAQSIAMKIKHLLLYGIALCSLLAAVDFAPGSTVTNYTANFTLSSTLAVGSLPYSVVAADVDGDSNPDLICANYNDTTLTVLTNNGSGGFGYNATYLDNAGGGYISVTAADVTGDGKMDLISANYGGNNLTVLTNKGNGIFVLASSPSVGSSPFSVMAADVNGDGKIDLISANKGNNTLTVLTNKGKGIVVLASSPSVGSGPTSVTAADVNGDGKTDLISANNNDNTLTVLTNKGKGIFVLDSTPSVGSGPTSVTAADVNGDGKIDLICANNNDNTLTVLTNNGSGGFVISSTLAVGIQPFSVTTADVNRNGKVDLICANYGNNTLTVLTNDGGGRFVIASSPSVGIEPVSVTAADINGDGLVDLISANHDNTLTVLTNTPFIIYPPVITGFTPTNGGYNAPVTITGSNLLSTASVTFNGAPATFVVNSDTQISANVPACAGAGPIVATNPAGAVSSTSDFIFQRQNAIVSALVETDLDTALCDGSNVTFSVSGTIVITSPLVIASDTTLDGTGQNVTISGNNSVGIFTVNPGVRLTLINLTIANGRVSSAGAGIYNNGGTVMVVNCTLRNNVAIGSSGGGAGAGGGIFNTNGGSVIIMGSTFTSNNVTGGIGSTGANGLVQYAVGGTGGNGGAGEGGGIYSDGGIVAITNCTFYGNQATGGQGGVGGNGYNGYYYYYCCQYDAFGNCIQQCIQYVYGGHGGNGGNGGSGYGGNLYNNSGGMTVINTTFADGSANPGVGGYPGLNGNLSSGYGVQGFNGSSGGGNMGQGAGSSAFVNCIVANPATGGNYVGGAIIDSGNNLSSDATVPFTNATSYINVNPNLGSLTNNGGPTLTLSLSLGSLAIDRGQTVGDLATDQRGLPRPSGSGFDIGAYEFQVIAIDAGLRAYDGTTTIKLACEGPDSITSSLLFNKNGTNYGILLTPTNSANASKFRIQTASGTKAFMKLP
jgi:hypothetical protein